MQRQRDWWRIYSSDASVIITPADSASSIWRLNARPVSIMELTSVWSAGTTIPISCSE